MKKKVLIVEDDNSLRKPLKTKLERAGYEVFEAAEGLSGLRMTSEQSFDLIILDIIMPKLDGLSLFRSLKKNSKTKDIPIFVLTNFVGAQAIDAQIEQKAAAFSMKAETSLSKILKTVQDIIGK